MFSGFIRYYKSSDKYKKGLWLYLFLLFIEGAMRKWFMPGLSSAWMICRDPIVIWTVLSLMNTHYLKSAVAKAFMAIGCIMMITTMAFGHQNFLVAIYGFRIWFFYIPYFFIMSEKLNREDLMRICQVLILVFLPMTVLYVMQWAAPANHWLNASVGGILAEGENTANGAVRPSGTFAHCVGSSSYNPLVVCLFCVTLFSGYYKGQFLTLKRGFLLLAIAVVVCLITSVSRGSVIQSILTIVFITCCLALTGQTKFFGRVIAGFVVIFVLFSVLSTVNIGGKNLMAPITNRFESASETEGGASGIMESRVLEPYKFWNDKGQMLDPPTFGYGIGAGSNYGTQTLHIKVSRLSQGDAWGLGEWSSQIVTNEMGFLFGGIVFFLRVGFCLTLFPICMRKLFRNRDILPISLWTLSVTYFGNGNINLAMSLGWIVLVMMLLLTSIRTSEKISG